MIPYHLDVQYSITPRERRLYVVIALILGLNLVLLCGALTFFVLIFRK